MSRYIFEVSWEVANKVGGIYTVLSSKAKYIKKRYGDFYFLIGPYLGAKNEAEFHFLKPPENFEPIINDLYAKGVMVYYGEWLIEGRPKVFLIDFSKYLTQVNYLKYELWVKFQIDSLRTGDDYNYPLAWSRAVSDFIEEVSKREEFKYSIFHFHEWLSGFALLFSLDLPIIKIFMTHATVVGRTLSSLNFDIWEKLKEIDPLAKAYEHSIEAKHMVEKRSAEKADYFVTISQVVKEEAEIILGRKVDFILPNGFDLSRFPTFEEISSEHRKNKNIILEFLLYLFTPYFKKHCPVENSLIFFTSGRKEIVNKGFDIIIKALNILNEKMKEENISKNIFFFFFVPDEIKDVNHEILNNLIVYKSLEEYFESIKNEINSKILHSLLHKNYNLTLEHIFSSEELLEIQRILNQIKASGNVPLSTHILSENNEFIKLFREEGLLNKEEDKVKVLLYPIYLSPADGFLNLNYYEAINGCHLGVFPSYYEPWGYTPLESLAAGVMTITSDLTGFANYLEEKRLIKRDFPGIWILRRKGRKNEEAAKDLAQMMMEIVKMKRIERIQNKYEARVLASHFDWEEMVKNYFEMYEKIIKKLNEG
ncbi:MAG: glycosyltransferase [Candidatus Pacebacteria bacterium]|nr:glycosyltransferase [Candidatus Paceibacterota bacterium]